MKMRIDRKDIREGDTVTVERAGDVIPHVVSVDKKNVLKSQKNFIFPKLCPSCGSATVKEFNKITKNLMQLEDVKMMVLIAKKIAIEKIKHFVSKDAFNIDGLGKKIVESFWNLKLIRNPSDIFKLDYEKISKLDGWGKLSAANLKYSIKKKKKFL